MEHIHTKTIQQTSQTKGNKTTVKSFKEYLEEARIKATLGKGVSAGGHGSGRDEKGWAHKSGKIIVWKGMKPYHIQYIVKNLSKFGLKEKEVLDVLEARFDSMDSPDPREDAEKHLEQLIAGYPIDRDATIEYLAMKKGWCRVVLGNYASIGGYDIRTIHQVAKQIDKKKNWTKGIKSLELWEYGESNGSIKKGNRVGHKLVGTLDNSYDVGLWVDGGSADPQNVGRGRTEIGRTMAQFREEVIHEAVLMDLINKNDSPLGFLADAMAAISNGTLKLKTRGVSNTRELAAAWNRVKKKKIKL